MMAVQDFIKSLRLEFVQYYFWNLFSVMLFLFFIFFAVFEVLLGNSFFLKGFELDKDDKYELLDLIAVVWIFLQGFINTVFIYPSKKKAFSLG